MKIKQLISIRKVFGGHSEEKLSVRLSYKIMKFLKASEHEDAFYNTEIQRIVGQFAEKDESGKTVVTNDGIKIAQDKLQDCASAILSLEDCDVEVPNITFTVEELEELKLSVQEMYALDELIKEE